MFLCTPFAVVVIPRMFASPLGTERIILLSLFMQLSMKLVMDFMSKAGWKWVETCPPRKHSAWVSTNRNPYFGSE